MSHVSPDISRRVDDLLGQLSLPEKVGLMFHTVIEVGADGRPLTGPGAISKTSTRHVVVDKHINHFNVHAIPDARTGARWYNAVQQLARGTAHGIPVTVSTDPRHAHVQNAGTSWPANFLSVWPDPLGFGALGDVDLVRRFADTVRREYRALGITAALHPTADLATEPRWGRQRETFGQDPQLVAELVAAYLEGLQGAELGPDSVAATTKHFPGAGPQANGEDAHFPYGRDQVYPGGRFEEHLEPFRRAIAAHTSGMMPYYGRPVGLELSGQAVEAVGFGFNKQVITQLLREELGFDGVILSDWELVNDNHVGDQVLPARAWGVEHLNPSERMVKLLEAGVDQFGGEECTELLIDLVAAGRVSESRLDESARRLLTVKFQLGLFDDPFVDEDAAVESVGRCDDVALGILTQSRSVVLLKNDGLLPRSAGSVYVEGIDPAAVANHGFTTVASPEKADLALVRVEAPFDPRDDLFLEQWFRQGSLDFRPGLVARLARIAEHCPLVLDVAMDRPAIVTPLMAHVACLTATFGVSDGAWLDAITGRVPPQGRLPFQLPRSMDAVRASREDVPGDTADPIFDIGAGIPFD